VAALVHVKTVVYPHVQYVDVAGLVRDAARGAGRGNQFLENIRDCDALVHVVRCFRNPDVAHVHGDLDPVADARTVNVELMLADIQAADRALERLGKQARRDEHARAACAALERARAHLDAERPIRTLAAPREEMDILKPFRFLTSRRVLYAANIGESDLPRGDPALLGPLGEFAAKEGNAVLPICAELEAEVAELKPDEAAAFLRDAGIEEPALQRLVRATCRLLGLVSFITFNQNEARAWTVPEGTRAQDAAGVIHSDFARHFIRAEVTAFADFDAMGGEKGAREKGLLRIEGREYTVRDGDVVYFRVGV
jgi:GTP-binding protein YchF